MKLLVFGFYQLLSANSLSIFDDGEEDDFGGIGIAPSEAGGSKLIE